MLSGIALLLLGGIPAVFEFMGMQGFPVNPTADLFVAHWFLMIYGFFGTLIGNEIFVALSVEWTGTRADDRLILAFLALTVSGALSFFLNEELGLLLVLAAMMVLLHYSKEYLGVSKLGLRPTVYNWLLFSAVMVTVAILAVQASLGYAMPYLNLVFPAGTVLAVMTRDIALVTGIKPSNLRNWENVVSFALLALGLGLMNSSVLLVSWALSFHASGLYRPKGRRYPIVHLLTAWIYYLIGSVFTSNYDVFVHAFAVGFLFNTVFGVDVVLMDMLVNAFQTRVSVKPSYVPFVLLNSGLIMRLLYDFGFNVPIFILSAPLQGVGILSFFALTLRQVVFSGKKGSTETSQKALGKPRAQK